MSNFIHYNPSAKTLQSPKITLQIKKTPGGTGGSNEDVLLQGTNAQTKE